MRTDRERAEHETRKTAALALFHELCGSRLEIDRGDAWQRRRPTPVVDRLEKALLALRGWRNIANQAHRLDDEVALGIRITAESMASEIVAAAGGDQDPATIAWVAAGLRCPARPFCTGCPSCFTIDAPGRHNDTTTAGGRG